MAVTLFDPP